MRAWLLVALCLCAICTTHAVGVDQHNHARQKQLREIQEASASASVAQKSKTPDSTDIKFIKPKDEHTEPLDPAIFTQRPSIVGTQAPSVERIPTPPSSYTHAPRILRPEDIQTHEDLYGDSSPSTSLVATADSHTQEPTPEPVAEHTPTPEAPVEAPATPTETEVESPPHETATGGVATGGEVSETSSTGEDDYDSEEGENEEDAQNKYRNALANDAIPKWFNVKDFVDEKARNEFIRSRDEATKVVDEEISKFKTEVLATVMEQFGKIIAGQPAASEGQEGEEAVDDEEGDEYDDNGVYDVDGGEGEAEGETYHEGYLDGEDDASQRGEDEEPEEEAAGASSDPAAPVPAEAGQTPQDAQVIASLQSEIDQMKNELITAHAAASAGVSVAAVAADPTLAVSATPAAEATSSQEPVPVPTSAAEATFEAGATEAATATPTESTESVEAAAAASTEATPTESTEATPAESTETATSTEGEVAEEPEATATEEEGEEGDEEGDDYDEEYGDDYDEEYGDDYGDDYDYDYDAEGGDEWGHDEHGHWGRKWGGGGGWASMSAPAGGIGGGVVKSYGQSGGSAGFSTNVATGTPKKITTIIGTTITPLGNGQTTISQNVERVQVDEYDEGVGSPGWAAGSGGVSPDTPVASPAVPEPLPEPATTEPAAPTTSTPTPTPAEPSTATPTEPAVAAPATPVEAAAATNAAAALSSEALVSLAKIRQASEAMLSPVHEPTGVDIANLKKLEESSDLLTRAADEVQRLSTFREKRKIQRMLNR